MNTSPLTNIAGTISAAAARLHLPDTREMAVVQSAYYLPTAITPFVSRKGFEAITGPKVDWWLVETVGALVGVIGGALALSTRRPAAPHEVRFLGLGTALALSAIDVMYVVRRRIAPVYLVDAAIELCLAAGWGIALRQDVSSNTRPV